LLILPALAALMVVAPMVVAPIVAPSGARAATLLAPPPAPAPSPAAAPPLSLADAAAIAAALAEGARQGLPEPQAAGWVAALSGNDPAAKAAAEQALSAAAVRLAGQQHGLGVDPAAIDDDFALSAPYDPAAAFDAARRAGQVAAWAAALAPAGPAYQPLVAARQRYAAIVAAGGWGEIAAGAPPKVGGADKRVPALRARLAAEGFVAPPPAPPAPVKPEPVKRKPGKRAAGHRAPRDRTNVFDAALAEQLKAFQATHGVAPSGKLDAATLAALNVPAADRLAAIDANLQRERWLPHDLPATRIEVDTGGPTATLYQAGAPVLAMRAVAGEPKKKTPTFASSVTGIVFNPPWNVPADIAKKELYPKGRGYLASHGYYVKNGQLVQRAGARSALGYVKFEMPDPFVVYLHDTPSRSLFKRDARWLSHGCVRLEQPRELAAALLAPQGWDRDAVDAAIAAGHTRYVALQVQPPVYVVYRTVVTTDDGRTAFRADVYGWDAKLAAAAQPKPPPATAGAPYGEADEGP
jgi:murein L,D-transpeptidase YcbB/YkuD